MSERVFSNANLKILCKINLFDVQKYRKNIAEIEMRQRYHRSLSLKWKSK